MLLWSASSGDDNFDDRPDENAGGFFDDVIDDNNFNAEVLDLERQIGTPKKINYKEPQRTPTSFVNVSSRTPPIHSNVSPRQTEEQGSIFKIYEPTSSDKKAATKSKMSDENWDIIQQNLDFSFDFHIDDPYNKNDNNNNESSSNTFDEYTNQYDDVLQKFNDWEMAITQKKPDEEIRHKHNVFINAQADFSIWKATTKLNQNAKWIQLQKNRNDAFFKWQQIQKESPLSMEVFNAKFEFNQANEKLIEYERKILQNLLPSDTEEESSNDNDKSKESTPIKFESGSNKSTPIKFEAAQEVDFETQMKRKKLRTQLEIAKSEFQEASPNDFDYVTKENNYLDLIRQVQELENSIATQSNDNDDDDDDDENEPFGDLNISDIHVNLPKKRPKNEWADTQSQVSAGATDIANMLDFETQAFLTEPRDNPPPETPAIELPADIDDLLANVLDDQDDQLDTALDDDETEQKENQPIIESTIKTDTQPNTDKSFALIDETLYENYKKNTNIDLQHIDNNLLKLYDFAQDTNYQKWQNEFKQFKNEKIQSIPLANVSSDNNLNPDYYNKFHATSMFLEVINADDVKTAPQMATKLYAKITDWNKNEPQNYENWLRKYFLNVYASFGVNNKEIKQTIPKYLGQIRKIFTITLNRPTLMTTKHITETYSYIFHQMPFVVLINNVFFNKLKYEIYKLYHDLDNLHKKHPENRFIEMKKINVLNTYQIVDTTYKAILIEKDHYLDKLKDTNFLKFQHTKIDNLSKENIHNENVRGDTFLNDIIQVGTLTDTMFPVLYKRGATQQLSQNYLNENANISENNDINKYFKESYLKAILKDVMFYHDSKTLDKFMVDIMKNIYNEHFYTKPPKINLKLKGTNYVKQFQTIKMNAEQRDYMRDQKEANKKLSKYVMNIINEIHKPVIALQYKSTQ